MNVTASISACPACAAVPLALERADHPSGTDGITLALPSIHCAACIGAVERQLLALPGVRSARVNLSRKRVYVDTTDLVAPETLIAALAAIGYEAHELDGQMMATVEADQAGNALLIRVAVAGFAMMNVMLFSVAVWSGAAESTRNMFHWFSAIITVPALIFSAQVFVLSAWGALRVGRLNMDVPITLAIVLACAMSVYETTQGGDQVYFDAALSLTFFLLLGRYLEHRMRIAARSAAQELNALELPRATRITEGTHNIVDVQNLRAGDHIAVMAGMRVPVDGILVKGRSDIDRALLTGESLPVPVSPGERMTAGEVNLTGPIEIEVTSNGADTSLRRMAALVEMAESARNRYTALADRAAAIYAPAVHLLALLSFVGWIAATGDWSRSMNIAIAVLIITCPCALGLAVPAVMTAASGRLFRSGMLVKNRTALERLAEADTVVFDKTGTLTEGHARLEIASLDPATLSVLAALAKGSQHPVSKMIAAALPNGTSTASLDQIVEHAGKGVEAVWQGQTVRLGSGKWVGCPDATALSIGRQEPIPVIISETLREGAIDAVDQLKQMGLAVYLFSGDTQDQVQTIAAKLGIATARSQMTPTQKQSAIAEMTETGRRVLMVGDGLNDTAALAQAHVSISPATALDASRAASDIVLMHKSLRNIPDAVLTARRARQRVLENFGLAASYNAIAIPIAVAGLATPLLAAIAMSLSSITVLLNALRVR